MSLINDALKRASETRKQSGDPPPPVTLNPVDYAIRPNPGFRFLVMLMLLAALAFALWFLSKWQEQTTTIGRRQVVTNSAPPAAETTSRASSPAVAKPRIVVSTNFVTREDLKPADAPSALNAGTATEATDRETPALAPASESTTSRTNPIASPNIAPAPEATNTFPQLKLQSIVYRLSKPAVVINGEMLYTGDTIKGARVVKIERMAVTLEWRGETNVLSLPRL